MYVLLALLCLVSIASSISLPIYVPFLRTPDEADNCVVNTTSGAIQPLVQPKYPDVDQFLDIPFAAPPVNNLRFAPPQPFSRSNKVIYANKSPPGCLQAPPIESIYSERAQNLLPVIVSVYGGGFVSGAANISYQIPTPWVQAKQNLIVVKLQYRLNIFGFPNSAALDEQNLGIQDIRIAVQWVYDNVAAFGGDPSKITLWGHSAGSIATNAYTFAFVNNPLTQATISTSGTTLTPREGWQSMDFVQSNFTFVAQHVGCSGNAASLLVCMRAKPASAITDFVYNYNGTNALTFKPIADGRFAFTNYTQRLLDGQVAKQPAIIGNSRREGERNLDKNLNPNGPNQTLALAYTVAAFLCPGELSSKLRHEIGLPTYRYEWKGNFTNISPLPWMGAYHGSLLPFFFGQTNCQSCHPQSGPSTPFELAVGSYMQDLWQAYANDPDSLQAEYDWPLYQGGSPNQTTDVVKLIPGIGQNISSIKYGAKREEYCAIVDPYLTGAKTLPPDLTV